LDVPEIRFVMEVSEVSTSFSDDDILGSEESSHGWPEPFMCEFRCCLFMILEEIMVCRNDIFCSYRTTNL
jgi:hypothetical protein